jgi:hypothetical protein
MIWTVFVVLFVIWLLAFFAFHVGTGLIHLILLGAVVALVVGLTAARPRGLLLHDLELGIGGLGRLGDRDGRRVVVELLRRVVAGRQERCAIPVAGQLTGCGNGFSGKVITRWLPSGAIQTTISVFFLTLTGSGSALP